MSAKEKASQDQEFRFLWRLSDRSRQVELPSLSSSDKQDDENDEDNQEYSSEDSDHDENREERRPRFASFTGPCDRA